MDKKDNNSKEKKKFPNFYDNYDYLSFWRGREYEDKADKIAVSNFLSFIKKKEDCSNLIDIGAGPGRLIPLYEFFCQKFTLLDSSIDQLKIAKKRAKKKEKLKTVLASADNIPLPGESYEVAVSIRMFHYIEDPEKVFQEVKKILKPNGYFILEIPNQIHIRNRLKSIFIKDYSKLVSKRLTTEKAKKEGFVFINHDPRKIINLLKSNNFEVIKILSASNFRSPLLKKIFPVSFLVSLEKISQRRLAKLFFGPSIYFLAKKVSIDNT